MCGVCGVGVGAAQAWVDGGGEVAEPRLRHAEGAAVDVEVDLQAQRGEAAGAAEGLGAGDVQVDVRVVPGEGQGGGVDFVVQAAP